jgi:hypothetical protein
VLAYRANHSDAILDWIVAQGPVSAVPPHESRAGTRETNGSVGKERARIECLFGKLKMKHFSRFERTRPSPSRIR